MREISLPPKAYGKSRKLSVVILIHIGLLSKRRSNVDTRHSMDLRCEVCLVPVGVL